MPAGPPPKVRFRFAGFTVSTARRVLLESGREVPLIPRYLDLLVLLLRRRDEAVHRREILEEVWSDVVVSDGALSQAVRTLRRALGDDPRDPTFIRTVSRHGYRFVHAGVVEEPDEPGPAEGRPAPAPEAPAPRDAPGPGPADPLDDAIGRLLALGPAFRDGEVEESRREAAEEILALGVGEALRRLDMRPGHETARTILRDARWDVPGAGEVPILRRPGAGRALALLCRIRLRRAARHAASRWGAAAGGGSAAGAFAGILGGIAMHVASGGGVRPRLLVVFALVGALLGFLGAAGVGAGLAVAEAIARSRRGAALAALGALGGGAIGLLAHSAGRWTLEGIFGHDLSPVGGALEGLALGGAAGLGYALATPRPGGGGMATPRGAARVLTAAVTGLCCAAAAPGVTWAGGSLGGASLDLIARSFQGSEVGLRPLARLFGEPDLGPITRSVLAAEEGFLFGLGLVLGITRRPR